MGHLIKGKLTPKLKRIPNNAELNLICDDTFQIYCNYQDSESETGNHFNLLGTISKPLFKACGSGLV